MLEYASPEVDEWFKLRPLVIHADRRDDYARSRDIEPYIGRMEFGAYDVLFNKATWRKADVAWPQTPICTNCTGVTRSGRFAIWSR